ncbi:DUF4270 domain-containing protein [Ichthyobacterium seriolicida]|uniref:DUF4270 domain-containing protein n=1 Tax=Ichthyobacterium seriolicida TaxID=242600 RepID=A0A1J1DXG8_9FLAO|nr:DUF4270 domain-containing protein [Ichthyobacterium seriolicida]BAV94554.1 hypothetical protein JBKA6_0541 [Ichthyobacterium seriolicida]
MGGFSYFLLFSLCVVSLLSCEKSVSIPLELVDTPLKTGMYSDSRVVIYNDIDSKIHSNPIDLYTFGVYKDPVFGTLKSSFALQVQLPDKVPGKDPNSNKKFGTNPVIDSVALYIPYLARGVDGVKKASSNIFDTDSIYGNRNSSINVQVLELLERIKHEDSVYYTNHNFALGTQAIANISFKPSIDSIALLINGEQKKYPPGLWLNLDKSFFKKKVIDNQGTPILENNVNFTESLKGLYVTVNSNNNSDGSIISVDPEKITLTIFYKNDETESGQNNRFDFKIKGVDAARVNKYEYTPSQEIRSIVSDNNRKTQGQSKVFVKGSTDLTTTIELFDETQLKSLRDSVWAVNNAELKIYTDNITRDNPQLRLFDKDSKRLLTDQIPLNSTGESLSQAYKDYGVSVSKDDKGYFYSFDITKHVQSILTKSVKRKKYGDNVKLGLEVKYKNTALGAVLFGNRQQADKGIKLVIHYTN